LSSPRARAIQCTGTEGMTVPADERQRALGLYGYESPSVLRASAGRDLLGTTLDEVASALDRIWFEGDGRTLLRLRDERASAAAELASLRQKESVERLDAGELLRKAVDIEFAESEWAAESAYREALEADPSNSLAAYSLGKILLEAGDPDGLHFLRGAAFQNEDAALATQAAQRARAFLAVRGRDTEAGEYAWRIDELTEVVRREELEGEIRSRVFASDAFVPHGLDAGTVAVIRRSLGRHDVVTRAYLVRRQRSSLAKDNTPILAIMTAAHRYSYLSLDRLAQAVEDLRWDVALPVGSLVVGLNPSADGALIRTIKRVAGARIL
jgi:hypothetical protein